MICCPQFGSSIDGTGGTFSASQTTLNPDQVVFSSAYLNFAANSSETATFSLSSLVPNFAVGTVVGGQAYPSSSGFNAAGAGTFSTAVAPTTTTPEPATFVLLGFSLVGLGKANLLRFHDTKQETTPGPHSKDAVQAYQ